MIYNSLPRVRKNNNVQPTSGMVHIKRSDAISLLQQARYWTHHNNLITFVWGLFLTAQIIVVIIARYDHPIVFEYRGCVVCIDFMAMSKLKYFKILLLLLINLIILMYGRFQRVYFLNKNTQRFVTNYNGQWIWLLLEIILYWLYNPLSGLLNPIIYILYYGCGNWRSKQQYSNGDVYKFVINKKDTKLYIWSEEQNKLLLSF